MSAVPPPDASEREVAKNSEIDPVDPALPSGEFTFVTRGLSDIEQAAVVAVLTQAHNEERKRLRRVERRPLQPWQRSQRAPERIVEPYSVD